MQYLLLFHCNNGYANAPQCCVINYVNSNFYRTTDLSSGPGQIRGFHCGRNVELLVVKFSLLYEDPDMVLFHVFFLLTVRQSLFFTTASSDCPVSRSRVAVYGSLETMMRCLLSFLVSYLWSSVPIYCVISCFFVSFIPSITFCDVLRHTLIKSYSNLQIRSL